MTANYSVEDSCMKRKNKMLPVKLMDASAK